MERLSRPGSRFTGWAAVLVGTVAGLVVASADATAATEYLQTLKEGSWLCTSPQVYDEAVQEARGRQGDDLENLRKQLGDRKLCIYVDGELVEKIMVPYAKVLERQGTKVKVEFTVEYRKRLEFLHRQIQRVTVAGWTDATNLEDREIL